MRPTRPTLAVFDLCDTLVAENTTVGFLRQLARTEPKVERSLARWTGRRHPLFLVGALAHRLGVDVARTALVRSLRGIDRAPIDRAAGDYAVDVLGRATNGRVAARLDAARAAGDRVLLLSTSLDPVVQAIAARLGVEGHGSPLEWLGDRATGHLADDYTGQKLARLRALFPGGWERLSVVSDNRSDLPLLREADEGILVVPAGHRLDSVPPGVDDVLRL